MPPTLKKRWPTDFTLDNPALDDVVMAGPNEKFEVREIVDLFDTAYATQAELDALVISGGGTSAASETEARTGTNTTKFVPPALASVALAPTTTGITSGADMVALPGGTIQLASGGYDSSPNPATISGDFAIAVWCALTDWTTGAIQNLAGRFNTVGNQRGYRFCVNGTGLPRLDISTGGTAGTTPALTGATAIPVIDGAGTWMLAVFDANDGAGNKRAQFYYAGGHPALIPDEWRALGAVVSSATAVTLHASTAPFTVGGGDAGTVNPAPGRYGRVVLWSAINSTTMLPSGNPIADRRYDTRTPAVHTDPYSNVFTLGGSTSWNNEPAKLHAVVANRDITSWLLRRVSEVQVDRGEIRLPAGKFTVSAGATLTDRCSIVGAGKEATILELDAAFAGPVFTVSDCWRTSGALSETNTTADWAATKAGVRLAEFSITGDRANAAEGIRLAARNDNVMLDRVGLFFLKGTALYVGHGTGGLCRESVFRDVTIRGCGDDATSAPAMVVTAGASAGDGTNQLLFDHLEMIYPHGVGIHIVNTITHSLRRVDFPSLMLHGGQDSHDVMLIEGNVDDLDIAGFRGNGSEATYWLVRTVEASTHTPTCIRIVGDMRSSVNGIKFDDISAADIQVTAQSSSISGTIMEFAANSVGQACWVSLIGGGSPTIDASVTALVKGFWAGAVVT